MFLEILDAEKVTTKETIKVETLLNRFGVVKSVDPRYDGENELIFNLSHKSESYRKFLRKPTYFKANKFTGQHAIFYKICDTKQKEHFTQILNEQHISYIDGINKRATDNTMKKYIKPQTF